MTPDPERVAARVPVTATWVLFAEIGLTAETEEGAEAQAVRIQDALIADTENVTGWTADLEQREDWKP